MTGHRIKVSNVKLVDGKLVKRPTYASASDKAKRQSSKRVKVKRK